MDSNHPRGRPGNGGEQQDEDPAPAAGLDGMTRAGTDGQDSTDHQHLYVGPEARDEEGRQDG